MMIALLVFVRSNGLIKKYKKGGAFYFRATVVRSSILLLELLELLILHRGEAVEAHQVTLASNAALGTACTSTPSK